MGGHVISVGLNEPHNYQDICSLKQSKNQSKMAAKTKVVSNCVGSTRSRTKQLHK